MRAWRGDGGGLRRRPVHRRAWPQRNMGVARRSVVCVAALGRSRRDLGSVRCGAAAPQSLLAEAQRIRPAGTLRNHPEQARGGPRLSRRRAAGEDLGAGSVDREVSSGYRGEARCGTAWHRPGEATRRWPRGVAHYGTPGAYTRCGASRQGAPRACSGMSPDQLRGVRRLTRGDLVDLLGGISWTSLGASGGSWIGSVY